MVFKVTITNRKPGAPPPSRPSTTFPVDLEIAGAEETLTVDDLSKALAAKLPKYYPDRQRLVYGKTVLKHGEPLSVAGVQSGDSIYFKDLGPQVGWRTVFLVEYFGPLVIHPLVYYLPQLFYGTDVVHGRVQQAAFLMVMAHFVKRELETLFVHRFSHGTMPIMNIFKNSFHYHVLSGVLLAYFSYGPSLAAAAPAAAISDNAYWGCIATFVLAEVANLHTHLTLRNLRPPGTRIRRIPRGFGFDIVSCPNYLFETLAWVSYSLLVRTYAGWFFTAVAFGQMYLWALKKHRAYRKEFSDYPRNRSAIIPFIA